MVLDRKKGCCRWVLEHYNIKSFSRRQQILYQSVVSKLQCKRDWSRAARWKALSNSCSWNLAIPGNLAIHQFLNTLMPQCLGTYCLRSLIPGSLDALIPWHNDTLKACCRPLANSCSSGNLENCSCQYLSPTRLII